MRFPACNVALRWPRGTITVCRRQSNHFCLLHSPYYVLPSPVKPLLPSAFAVLRSAIASQTTSFAVVSQATPFRGVAYAVAIFTFAVLRSAIASQTTSFCLLSSPTSASCISVLRSTIASHGSTDFCIQSTDFNLLHSPYCFLPLPTSASCIVLLSPRHQYLSSVVSVLRSVISVPLILHAATSAFCNHDSAIIRQIKKLSKKKFYGAHNPCAASQLHAARVLLIYIFFACFCYV